ncbi:hypothetical protein ABZ479_40465 [Streptomyces sp. NPDC005722]
MPVDWSRLDDAYGSAEQLGPLFDEVGDPELEDDAWFELWERLYHQGSVYPASFAALPVLADIATGRRPGEQARALALAGRIVAGEGQLHEPGHVRAHFPAALDELRQVMHRVLVQWSFDGDEDDHLYADRGWYDDTEYEDAVRRAGRAERFGWWAVAGVTGVIGCVLVVLAVVCAIALLAAVYLLMAGAPYERHVPRIVPDRALSRFRGNRIVCQPVGRGVRGSSGRGPAGVDPEVHVRGAPADAQTSRRVEGSEEHARRA